MPEQTAPVLITAVDFTPDALHVTFATGEFSTYEAAFLFASRVQQDNLIVLKEIKPRMPPKRRIM